MNSQLRNDFISHLQNTGYNDSLGMKPVINFLKARGVEPTDSLLNDAKELIFLNF